MPLFLASYTEQQFDIRDPIAIVSILCISFDGGILRSVSVLYYAMVEKAETF